MKDRPPKHGSTVRVEALSDGLFSIVLTLLVFDVKVPQVAGSVTEGELAVALQVFWPRLFIAGVSFLVVGFYWVTHHLVFAAIARSDRGLLWINLLNLLTVAFLPLSTELLIEYSSQPLAIAIYGGNLVLVGLSQFAVWVYAAARHRLIHRQSSERAVRVATIRLAVLPVASLAAIALSAASTTASIAVFIMTPLLYVLTGARHALAEHKTQERQEEQI